MLLPASASQALGHPPCRGVAPPWPPPKPNLVSFTSKFASVFTNITSTVADNHRIELHVILSLYIHDLPWC